MKRRFSDSKPDTTPSSSQRDARRGKRVKFTDNEVDIASPLSFRFNATSVPVVGSMKSKRRSEDAKTSEFAFFKKLKENAGVKFASHSLHNEMINQSNDLRLRNASEDNVIRNAALISEKTSVVNNGSENIRSSLLVENATPVGLVSFDSPLAGAGTLKSLDAQMKKARVTFDDVQRRAQDMEECSLLFRPQGTQHENAEIFSMKRQKLRQLVRDISSPEVDGLNLKGHDIVSKLLSRLIPESKDNNNLKDKKFGQVDTDAKSILAAYPDADSHCKNLQQITTRASTEHEFGPYLDDDIPYYQSNRSKGRILYLDAPYSHDNTTNHHDNTTNHRHRLWESDSEINGESYSHFAFPTTRFRSVEPVDELVKICQPNRYLIGSSLNTPTLGWESYDKKPEKGLSISFQDIEPISYPTSLIPWVNDSKFDGRGLFSLPPSIHINEEPESPLPLSRISSYNSHEYGMSVLEAEENKLSDSDNIQLAVSCRQSYFSPVKDSFNDTDFLNQDHWFISKIFNQGNHHPQIESLLPAELVLGLDWKRFPISSFPRDLYSASYHSLKYPTNRRQIQHCNEHDEYENSRDNSCHKGTLARFSGEVEDNISVLNWSSSCFQISLDRENAFSLDT